MKRPILLITLGIPGSGKTHFSENFAKEINAVHLNSDKLRIELIADPLYNHEEHQIVFKAMDYMTQEFLKQGISVVYDANMNKRIFRKRMQQMAKKYNAQYLLAYIEVPLEVAIERSATRGEKVKGDRKKLYRSIDAKIVHKLKDEIELPTKSEPHVYLSGEDTFINQKKLIHDAIRKL